MHEFGRCTNSELMGEGERESENTNHDAFVIEWRVHFCMASVQLISRTLKTFILFEPKGNCVA